MIGDLLLVMLPAARPASSEGPEFKLPPCKEWTAVNTIGEIPEPLRGDLRSRVGVIADPGRPFSAGCTAMEGEALTRLLFAGRSGPHWVVAYERGGIAYRQEVSLWTLPEEGASQLLGWAVLPGRADDLCRLIAELRSHRLGLETGR